MLDKKNKAYAFLFAGLVCVTCSFVLATAAQGLKARQEKNLEIDIQRNILRSVGIPAEGETLASADVEQAYKENIREYVLNSNGQIIKDMAPVEIPKEKLGEYHSLYVRVSGDKINSYVIPVSGKGLWSTIYGYLALEPDAMTVRGVTFYKHGETPGLGAEVEKEWFTDQFKGKQVFDESGSLQSIVVAKGKVEDVAAEEDWDHYVDGISGATMTGKGMNEFIERDLAAYQPFFQNIHNYSKEG